MAGTRPTPVSERGFERAATAPGSRRILQGRAQALLTELSAAPAQWRIFAIGLTLALGSILALGATYDLTGRLHWFELRGEAIEGGFYAPVMFNWWMLCFAGVAALSLSRWAVTPAEQYTWIGMGLFLGFMGCDELLMIHERLEFRTGVDWQLLYLPVVAVGGIAYLRALRTMPRWSLSQVIWIAAAGLWVASEIFEKFEYTGADVAVRGFALLDGIEKVFQFTGSALFLLVTLLALELAVSRPVDEAR